MKTTRVFPFKSYFSPLISFLLIFVFSTGLLASTIHKEQFQQTLTEYKQYSGVVVDSQTGVPLVFATLSVNDSNISTITNTEGEFLIKIPENLKDIKLTISILGYKKKVLLLSNLKKENNRIALDISVTKLSEVVFNLPKDAKTLVRTVFKKRDENYIDKHVLMTAFYRETIKKRRKNVSLAEAIVRVYKQPYSSLKKDKIKLYKARKNTDYSKLDTIALKLQGGPFNALYIDVMKYPEYIFSDNIVDLYNYSFAPSTTVNERPVYVVNFKQRKSVTEPLFYGKLYIDAETLALVSAIYNLNVSNRDLASKLFVKKKPKDIFVYPTAVAYRVDYREKNGKWYYGYGNVQLTFKIERKGKWFNSYYSISSEMAITDWKMNIDKEKPTYRESMRYSIIISDEASGFSDPEFWGAFNVIEPEKSIESAIKKINRQLKKVDN